MAVEGFGQKKTFKRLEPMAFYEMLIKNQDALIIDVRPESKFEAYRMNDAILAASQKELMEIVKDQPKEKPLFIYCEYGDRSKTAGKLLVKKGFKQVYDLKGGLKKWKEQGLEIDSTSVR